MEFSPLKKKNCPRSSALAVANLVLIRFVDITIVVMLSILLSNFYVNFFVVYPKNTFHFRYAANGKPSFTSCYTLYTEL